MSRLRGDLLDRTKKFALLILDLVDQLTDGTRGWEIGRQLVRSGTGIGANLREADGAISDREFASIVNVARREAAETMYWLELCRDSPRLLGDPSAANDLITESDELHRILATIVRKTQDSLT